MMFKSYTVAHSWGVRDRADNDAWQQPAHHHRFADDDLHDCRAGAARAGPCVTVTYLAYKRGLITHTLRQAKRCHHQPRTDVVYMLRLHTVGDEPR